MFGCFVEFDFLSLLIGFIRVFSFFCISIQFVRYVVIGNIVYEIGIVFVNGVKFGFIGIFRYVLLNMLIFSFCYYLY